MPAPSTRQTLLITKSHQTSSVRGAGKTHITLIKGSGKPG